jgi:hypothetical protein
MRRVLAVLSTLTLTGCVTAERQAQIAADERYCTRFAAPGSLTHQGCRQQREIDRNPLAAAAVALSPGTRVHRRTVIVIPQE